MKIKVAIFTVTFPFAILTIDVFPFLVSEIFSDAPAFELSFILLFAVPLSVSGCAQQDIRGGTYVALKPQFSFMCFITKVKDLHSVM